jgi:shikimate dehydrogenase
MIDLDGLTDTQHGIRSIGLIGDPVEYSLSSILFDFLLSELDLGGSWRYRAWRLSEHQLQGFLYDAAQRGVLGLNVTIPHKERVLPLLDEIDRHARLLGAVNTIVNQNGRLKGYNTDWQAFLCSLRAHDVELAGRNVVVLGAGGAARAIIYGLIHESVAGITIYNRTAARAERLANELSQKAGFHRITVLKADNGADSLAKAIYHASLLINATSVGMYPAMSESPIADPESLYARLIVYDLIYNPLQTQLIRQAAAQGAQVVSGLEMLIYQALESLKLWAAQAGEESTVCDVERLVPALRERLTRHLENR